MNQPRSIFTGSSTADESLIRVDSRRLSTPEYQESLFARPGAIKPNSAPSSSINPFSPPLSWTRKYDAADTCGSNERSSLSGQAAGGKPIDRRQNPLQPAKTPPVKKRSITQADLPAPSDTNAEPLLKRRKLRARSRHALDPFDFPGISKSADQPPSPLFFSNSRTRQRPPLPARFSSSEAAARMLSNARGEEESAIKTVTLARGTFSSITPPAPTRIPYQRASSERSSVPRTTSSDGSDKSEPQRMLGSIGVIELLDQDPKPSFVIDLLNAHNYDTGPLHLFFINAALRGNSKLLELIGGSAQNAETTQAHDTRSLTQFKSWVLSAVVSGEALDMALPMIEHAGLTWSCTTLRKRLRLVSGTYTAALSSAASHDTLEKLHIPRGSAPQPERSLPISPASARARFAPLEQAEPQDYFGDAALPQASGTPGSGSMADVEVVPSTEQLHDALSNSIDGGALDDEGRISESKSDPTLADECVLRATVAGDVDRSFRVPSPDKEIGFFDWTRLPNSPSLPRHIQFARSVDWASTALGPIEEWPPDLRQMCNLIMASPHPAAMYWGEELVAIYNEAYILLAGQKHPRLMGQSYKEAWAEIWDEVKDVFTNAKQTGQATMKDDDCLFINRNDYLEEVYFSWSIIPMVGVDGTVMGLYNPAFEKTRRKIAERRMLTLREVGERTASARDVKSFWAEVLSALQTNEFDAPFVLLYSVSEDADSDSSSIHSSSIIGTRKCFLEGTLGIPEGHASAPPEIELKSGMEGFGPVFREVMKTDKPVVLEIGTGDLPAQMMDGILWRGFGDPCRAVVVCPIHPTTGESILGFLVMGVNPRRPYDDDYSLFVQLLSRQLATSLASVVLFEEEIRRGQKAAKLAALDRMELSEQLAARTLEAKENETRFTRMAEFSPAGLFIANSEGHVTYCNDTWYEISRVPKDERSTDRWIDAVKEEDQPMVKKLWSELIDSAKPITAEFRFKAPWEDRTGNRGDTWVLFSAFPEVEEQGKLKSVFGCLTNISQQKWAEGFQKRKMEEAVELKRQQENFIDITSHEMRNPLSAILQCADEISTTLTEFKNSGNKMMDEDLISNSIDAAQTIGLCALHQKRIVDDILTLSKLDSAILHVTPVDVQPLSVVQRALKMFENEVQTAKIQMQFVIEDSYKELGIDWVKLDPSRVLQVLINLTGNAIKFTTREEHKAIKVTLAAYTERPSRSSSAPVKYFPNRSKPADQSGPDWGTGEEIFLQFAVKDTGRGLSEEEKKLLFMRFSQASPRTHVQYGGSGLGLFISRELTELQGGEIGVASEAGKGSTFAFYIKCRRSARPEREAELLQLPSPLPRAVEMQRKVDAEPKAKDLAVDRPLAAVGAAAAERAKAKDRGRIRVLIVEDNLVNQRVLENQLKRTGFSTAVANHGGEALEMLESSKYWIDSSSDAPSLNVLLMDQEMPVMDGLECTRKIRELENEGKLKRHVPIIGVTANARQEQIDALLHAGMDDVMPKPFTILELVPKIAELYERYPELRPAVEAEAPQR